MTPPPCRLRQPRTEQWQPRNRISSVLLVGYCPKARLQRRLCWASWAFRSHLCGRQMRRPLRRLLAFPINRLGPRATRRPQDVISNKAPVYALQSARFQARLQGIYFFSPAIYEAAWTDADAARRATLL